MSSLKHIMKKIKTNGKVVSTILCMALLAGCSKQDGQQQQLNQAPAMMLAPEKPATTKDQLSYYSQHLKEAKQTWHDYQDKGLSTLSDADRSQCIAVQTA